MRRLVVLAATCVALAVGPQHSEAQSRSGLLPPSLLGRYGLVRAWYAQVELDSARARVSHVTQHVSNSHGTTIVDVVLVDNEKQRLATFTDRQLDAFGKPLGPEGAKKNAEEKIAELQAIGIPAKAITTVVPDITLYVTTDSGVLHAIDGETGATRWVIPVGRSDHPSFAPAANDHFVAAINGITLYVFDARDGRLAWSHRLTRAPGAGPAVSQEFVHVPLTPGLLESYHLFDSRIPMRVYQSFGRALLQPVISPASVIWATDRGFLYVGNADIPGVRFRLETQGEIVARPAWLGPNKVIGVSLDGDVYMVNEFTGNLLWRFSTGDPIAHSPITIDKDVYVITNNHTLFHLSSETGGSVPSALWSAPNVRKFLALSKERLYCLDHIGRVTIMDRATGGRIATLPIILGDVEFLNYQTDRLYFVSDTGLIQCFHEVGLEYPLIHAGPGIEAPAPRAVKQQPLPAAGAAPGQPPPGANPFGGDDADDPFGGDPFGGGAPGGGAPARPATSPPAAADPFGGVDPFGSP